jgi:hypothetical protein
VAAADHFWRLLPRNDAVLAQKTICDALADVDGGRHPSIDQVRAVLTLDRRAQKLLQALLIGYNGPSAHSHSLEKRYWKAAFDLCDSFGQAYGHIFRYTRDSAPSRGWHEYAPLLLLRMFQHRQIECLLRPFESSRSASLRWPEVHEAYQYAHTHGLLQETLQVHRIHEPEKTPTTLEREYLHVLMLDLANGGQFSPYDAFWINRQMPRWCDALKLESVGPHGGADPDGGGEHFVVDLDTPNGLVRAPAATGGLCLYLDTTPLLALISGQTAALRDVTKPARTTRAFGRGRQLTLLRKLAVIYSPKPQRISRRGERKSVALDVEVVVGLNYILRALHEDQRYHAVAAPMAVPEVEEITITAFGGYTETPVTAQFGGEGPATMGLAGKLVMPHPVWQVRDRSESGCRLHGQVADSKGVVPGALLAFRERAGIPWTIVVVRRLKKLAGHHIDVGVEYVGQDPRRVAIVGSVVGGAAPGAAPDDLEKPFFALYLPESAKHPTMPIKTLVVPAHEFEEDRCLKLRSADAVHLIRIKEPIEEQGEFVWSPFEVVERRAGERAA